MLYLKSTLSPPKLGDFGVLIKEVYVAYLVLFVMLWRCIYRGRFNTFYSLCLGMRLVWGLGMRLAWGLGMRLVCLSLCIGYDVAHMWTFGVTVMLMAVFTNPDRLLQLQSRSRVCQQSHSKHSHTKSLLYHCTAHQTTTQAPEE